MFKSYIDLIYWTIYNTISSETVDHDESDPEKEEDGRGDVFGTSWSTELCLSKHTQPPASTDQSQTRECHDSVEKDLKFIVKYFSRYLLCIQEPGS